jgi:hypothetical protein
LRNINYQSCSRVFLLALVCSLFGCKQWELPKDKSLKVCQKPSNIKILQDLADPKKLILSLDGNLNDIKNVSWVIQQGSSKIGEASLPANQSFQFTTPIGGTLSISANFTTVCNENGSVLQNIKIDDVYKLWDITIGGDNNDNMSTMLTIEQYSTFWLGGSSSSSNSTDKRGDNKGSNDFWVVQCDTKTGTRLSDKTWGGSGFDILSGMIRMPDGHLLLAGWSNSNISGDKTENSRGNADFWIVKMDTLGRKLWDKSYGGINDDALQTVVLTNDGGALLGGWSNSNSSFEKTESSKGGIDYWIVKINSNGVKQWDKTFGGASDDILTNIIPTPDNGFLLAGYSKSQKYLDKSEASRGESDYWVVKINSSGAKEWDKTYGGTSEEELTSAIRTLDGGFVLAGWSSTCIPQGEKTPPCRGGRDYWIVKIAIDGTKQWDKTFGGSGDDDADAIIQTLDGGFLIGGASASSVSVDKTENSRGNRDFWVIKTDANGTRQWDKTLGGANYDYLIDIKPLSTGEFILGGMSSSNTGNEKTANSRGLNDYWTIKIK